jgi:polysaccharide pyruvyl transferase CsaB
MKIMIFAAGGDIGGAKTHILSIAKDLLKNNQIRLVSFHSGLLTEEGEELGLDIEIIENGLNIVRDIRDTLAAVDRYQPDIVHCHGARANMFGLLVKKFRSVPVMTTVHSDPALDYLGMPWKQFTFGFINSIALRQMDYYIAVADHMESLLIRRGYDPQRIFTIFNGLDFSKANPGGRPSKPADEPVVVGIAARLTPIKDIATVLRAFAKAAEKNPLLRLRIAGTGEVEKDLRELALELGIAPKVEFMGWVSDIKGFFRSVDINVLASLSEIMPYSLLEGAHEHCPAIASRVGGIPALIRHGENGLLFEPGDVDTFADYIYDLSVDEKERERLAENLYQRAQTDFSLEGMRRNQEKVYATVKRRAALRGRRGTVICGAYGRGNAGDEAILKAILTQLRQIDPDMDFRVMSRNPAETREDHKVRSIYIFNIPAFLRNLRQAKIFVSGGGSLIQDVTSFRSLYFYLFTLQAAKWSGCRTIMYGCGIGPIGSSRNSRLAAKVLNRTADVITLRDSRSVNLLASMGVDRPIIRLAADPTVTLRRAPLADIDAAFRSENIPQHIRKIGFCLRDVAGSFDPLPIAQAADYAYETYGLTPVFLPMEVPRDIAAADFVTREVTVPHYAGNQRHDVEELIGMLGTMEIVVGMRLHSLIFATAGGAPVIGISYDIKVDSFIEDIGSTACLPLKQVNAADLCRLIDEAVLTGDHQAKTAVERLRRAERVNRQAAAMLISENGSDNGEGGFASAT